MKAVNQCIGRAVRHRNDYATVLLLDERYGRPSTHKALPDWIKRSLKVRGGSEAFDLIAQVMRIETYCCSVNHRRFFVCIAVLQRKRQHSSLRKFIGLTLPGWALFLCVFAWSSAEFCFPNSLESIFICDCLDFNTQPFSYRIFAFLWLQCSFLLLLRLLGSHLNTLFLRVLQSVHIGSLLCLSPLHF